MARNQDEEHHEYILKEMYVPPVASDKSSEHGLVDLVFVHGLGGNLRGTWKQEGTHEPWFSKPEFLGRLKGQVRALSFGYNANRFGDIANTRIIHHANDLLRNLVLKRLDDPHRPLIFIAHSLGGLIVKRAILLCATNDDWSAIKGSTKSIIFMGTPHMGSEKAEDLVVVQKLASLMKFQTPIATNLTKELKTFSTAVQDINMEFTIDVHRSIKLLCCYESHPQRLPGGSKEIIVPQWSAVLQGVDNIDLNCTHSGLPKFSSPSEPRFELFWGEVERLVQKATAPPPKLLKAPTWTDEEVAQSTPPRARQSVPSRRRHEVAQKGLKPSRASIIRTSANEILKEVRRGIVTESPAEPESTVSQMEDREKLEKIDPKEFTDFTRCLRTITPENKGLDREKPHYQTCDWILSDPIFTEWKERDEAGLLFITGSPGCGKSNLAKYIQGVMERPNTEDGEESVVVSFYCDSLETSRANPPILDLVVKELLGKQRALSRAVRQKLHSYLDTITSDRKAHSLREPTSEVQFNHLMEVVQTLVMDKHSTPACLIIDGLDQCEDEFILKLLRGLDTVFRRDGSTSTLKMVITSRMADSIRGFALANSHIEITPGLIGDDIQRVVDEEVDRIIVARQIATIGRDSVSAVIVERANGSFLFASSVLKELWYIKDTGANSVFTLVTSCPSTMEAIYQQDMSRLEAERPDLFKLVQILCIARRALRIPEAREILRVQNPDITENYDLIGDLTKMCQRLVKFGGEDTLELLHQTLYDFIINTYDVSLIHETFAEVCLEYLSNVDWERALAYRNQRRRPRYPPPFQFLDYASPWMGYHWRNAGIHGKDKAWDLWDFICSDEGRKWQVYNLPRGRGDAPPVVQVTTPSTTSLAFVSHSEAEDSGSDSGSEDGEKEQGPLILRRSRDLEEEADDNASVASFASNSSASSRWSGSVITGDRPPKPPLVVLAQWDVDIIIREIFFEALESSPRQLLHSFLGMVPYVSRSGVTSRKEFRDMVNNIWEGTTAVHYAAAQSGKALEVLLPFVNDINLPDEDGATPLILAAASGEVKGVSLLLEAGAEIDLVDGWHQTALYSALHADSTEVVRMLLEHGANPDIPANSGHSPLEVTIGKNHLEYAQLLLESSPDITAPMTTGQPPAFLASRLGSHEVLEALLPHIDVDQVWDGERIIHNSIWRGMDSVVKKLIRVGANLNDPPIDTPKATPVALAVECGHNTMLKALLAAGAKVECPILNMSAPLHIGASRGNVDACKQLIRAGCNLEAESERGRTAIYVASDTQKLPVVELLVHHGVDPNKPKYEPPLQIAADVGNLELMKILLAGRISPNVDAKGETEETALGIAANYGDLPMVITLIDHGADPNLRSGMRTSNTPLQLALSGRHRKTVIELLKRGADPFPEHPKELSPFHTACFHGYIDVIETFFEVVDDLDELINFEWGWYGTPLLQAALGGQFETVELLLEKGADPNYRLKSKINRDKTLLHAAAEGGDIKALEAIVAVIQEPNFEVRDFKQRTPLYYACVEGKEEMVEYLLEKGVQTDVVLTTGENLTAGIIDGGSAKILSQVLEKNPEMDIDTPRHDGKTPLFFAVMHGHAEITSILLERGADVNRYSNNREFPLLEAIRYREKATLQVLLEHEATDLTQKDVFGRSALQIAQNAGSHSMPGMVLAAAKDPKLEAELMENRDMYGLNTYDHTRIDIRHETDWGDCIEAIRRETQHLLDDFAPRGPRWERLGKFLLQVSAYSFAEVVLQRSIEAVETTPLFLEHQVHCRLCLDLIPGTRYTCKTCCNTDLCQTCIGRYPSLGYRMWTCQYHTYYQVKLPGAEQPKKPWPKRHPEESFITVHSLPPIQEESDVEFEGEEHDMVVIDEEGNAIESDAETDDPPPAYSIEMASRHSSASPPVYANTPGSGSSDVDSDDEEERGMEHIKPPLQEYVEPTQSQLCYFLEEILKIFAVGQKPSRLVKWDWSTEKWKPEYDRRALVHPDSDSRHADILVPDRGPFPLPQQSEAYNYLAGLAYLFADVPLHLVLTGLDFKGYHRRAAKKKKQLQKRVNKVINLDRVYIEHEGRILFID
ncbi:Fc.00g084800.m01.CDS01 [Cosmosporella sp. VM-42]